MNLLRPVFIGALTALLVLLPRWLRVQIESDFEFVTFLVPGMVLLGGVFYFTFRKKIFQKKYYGVGSLVAHVHEPPTLASPERWSIRSVFSALLSWFGGPWGIEGAAVEAAQGILGKTRSFSANWNESQRRTDAACALSAGLSAAFNAPFAAIIFPLEMGIGGRTLSSTLASLASFSVFRLIDQKIFPMIFQHAPEPLLNLNQLSVLESLQWKHWALLAVLGIILGVIAIAFIRFTRLGYQSFDEIFLNRPQLKGLVGITLLLAIAFIYPDAMDSYGGMVQKALDPSRYTGLQGLTVLAIFLGLSVSTVVFGSVGIFWPLIAMGSFFGQAFSQFTPDLGPIAVLSAAGGVLAGVLGSPVAASVLVMELSGQSGFLLPALFTCALAHGTRKLMGEKNLTENALELQGLKFKDGRSISILENIKVSEAMVRDQVAVHEHAFVSEIQEKIKLSPYPFLPVVTGKDKYLGLLTSDMVSEAEFVHQKGGGPSHLEKLLEAKDILYRYPLKVPTVGENDSLQKVSGHFKQTPVVPVTDREDRVIGLLFAHDVRISYDQKIARQALDFRDAPKQDDLPPQDLS